MAMMTTKVATIAPLSNTTDNATLVVADPLPEGKSVEAILWIVFSPILFIAGVTGNILNVCILVHLKFKKNTTLTLLLFLALTDITVLILGLSRYFLLYAADFDLRTLTNFGCSLSLFLIYFCMQLSSWLLVQITVIRFMKTAFPLRARNPYSFTKQRPSMMVFGIIVLFLLSVNAHFFWTNGINQDGDCGSLTADFLYFDEFVFIYIDFILLSVIPAVIIIVLNVFIVKKIRSLKGNADSHISSITKTLLFTSVYFVCANFPICIYFIVDSYCRSSADKQTTTQLDIAWSVTYLFQFSHFASNFFFYTGTNGRFRTALRLVIKRAKNRIRCKTLFPAETRDISTEEHSPLSHSTLSSKKKPEQSSQMSETDKSLSNL